MPPASQDPIVAAIEGLRADLGTRHDENTSAIADVKSGLAENTRKIDEVLKAFPNGDVVGHHDYHDEIMQALADRKRMRQAVLMHLVKASTWIMLLGLLGLILTALKGWIRGVVGQ
jgi:hypothetical protein